MWKKLIRDEVRDSFGLSEYRDAIDDATSGYPSLQSQFNPSWREEYHAKRKREGQHQFHELDKPRKKQKVSNNMPRRPIPMELGEHSGPKKTSRTSYRAKYHTALGEKPSRKCNRVTTQEITTDNTLDDKRLHSTRLVEVPYSANDYEANRRHSFKCWVKGIKLRWTVKAKATFDLAQPLTIRWAILQPETNTGASTDVNVTEFFRDEDTAQDHYDDFPTTGVYTEYMRKALNTDKYGIIKTGSFTISPSTTGTTTVKHWASTKMFNIWVPINKILTWTNVAAGVDDEFPESNVHLVWWYCERGTLGTAQIYPTTGSTPLEQLVEKQVYFKNIHV